MAKQTVYLLVEVTINDGQFDLFEGVAREMTAGSQKEPGTLGYEWFLSADHKRGRLIETYADANAVLAHFTGPVVQQLVPKALAHGRIDRFEVYGDAGPEAGAMIATLGAEFFAFWQGIGR